MPLFDYKGLNRTGKNVRGTIDADNSRSAKLKLKKEGIYVVALKDKTRRSKKGVRKVAGGVRKVTVPETSMMTRQLATLIKANVPLVESLAAVSDQVENPYLSDVLADIKNSVNEGSSFYKTLARYPKIFDKVYVSMCEAGEMSGTLDVILIRLAEFTEAQRELTEKIKGALIYPVMMICFMSLLMGYLFVSVIPKIVVVFESSPELELEWYTVAIIDFSNFMVNYWHILLIGSAILVLILRNWKNTPSGRVQWDAMSLKVPVVGRLSRTVAVSRFARTLATLLDGGVPMLTAMGIVRNVVNNEVLARSIDLARDNISEGESIAGPLKKSKQFPPIVIHMINIGEKTGELENMLTQVSDTYDFQVNTEVAGLTSALGPAMIMLMGAVVGIIVFAIMMPMFQLTNLGG